MTSSAEPVEAVILDMGGVITLSPFALVDAVGVEAGLQVGEVAARMRSEAPMIERVERGEISLAEYFVLVCADIRADFGVELDSEQLVEGVRNSLVPLDGMLDLVRAIGGRHRTAILTNNTTDLAEVWQARIPPDLVDVVIDSSVVGMRKPEPRIYRLTLERLDVAATSAVFVDDQEVNLVPARDMGMRTIRFRSIEQLEQELADMGVAAR